MVKTILFVDSKVIDYTSLLTDLGNDIEVHMLNANKDGVFQIANILKGRSDLDSIHIVSHGSSRMLSLGSTVLNSDNLERYANVLNKIGSSLSETGDILLYGCDVAKGERGLSFINQFSALTGADIAASTNLTGVDGDWNLEINTGAIETNVINELVSDYKQNLSLGNYQSIATDAEIIGKLTVTGSKWFSNTVSYGVNTATPTNHSILGFFLPSETVDEMSETQVSTAKLAFSFWDDLLPITLIEDTTTNSSNANITLNYAKNTENDGTYTRSWNIETTFDYKSASQIWLSSNWNTNQDTGMKLGQYGLTSMIHEIGHALGLEHPGSYDAHLEKTAIYEQNAIFSQDIRKNTIMSYFGKYDLINNEWTTNKDTIGIYPQTPMLYDIAAIQSLYGVDTTTRTTNTVYGYNCNLAATDSKKQIYDFSQNKIPIFTIWDADGDDTLDCSGAIQSQTINLNEGGYSSVMGMNENIAIAFNTIIENAKGGSGKDTIIGNDAANLLNGGNNDDTLLGGLENDRLIGGKGNDVLNGGGGADILTGNTGNDIYIVDNSKDIVVEVSTLTTEIDTVKSLISYTLSDNVENLTYINITDSSELNGNALNNIITVLNANTQESNGFSNRLFGLAGNDLLFGSVGKDLLAGGDNDDTLNGGAGADNMMGGFGCDTYIVDDKGDVVSDVLTFTSEIDKVESSIGYTLPANVENLTLVGDAIYGLGNELNNSITGNAQANNLDGGVGADVLRGKSGDDTYFVDNLADVVIEAENAGTDTVNSLVSYPLLANVENLILGRIGDTAAINGTGNSLDNRILGNDGSNYLKGGAGIDTLDGGAGNDTLDGGTGADSMYGGIYNDTYFVDNTGDIIIEELSGGTDVVNSSVTYTLPVNTESLILTGTAAINGTGNSGFNRLIGNVANNILSGGSGICELSGNAGKDTLIGGNGIDSLSGGEGSDLLSGGFSGDYYFLGETTPATDTVRITEGDSIYTYSSGGRDRVFGFQLGKSTTSSAGVDRLDLDNPSIAANATKVNGTDYGNIHSHQIANGLITFDDSDAYAAAIAVTSNNLTDVFAYLHQNLSDKDAVAFKATDGVENVTYIFEQGLTVVMSSLIELQGVIATGLSTNGLMAGSVWIV